MKILVNRGGKDYGPYPVALIQQYVTDGQIFPHDLARQEGEPHASQRPLSQVLSEAGIAYDAGPKGNPLRLAMDNIRSFELRLVFPWQEVWSRRWMRDRKLLYLAGVGLIPAIALTVSPGPWAGYWAIALYFSALWALFFYYLLRTRQVELKYCFLCFFATGLLSIPFLLLVQPIPPWRTLYAMAKSPLLPVRFVGMLFGVGINEEICKAAVVFWLVKRPGKYLIPQTVVFYAMMSGLGFGIYEGVAYQQTVNREQGVDTAYLLNVARLTSLPFLHAIWSGLAGYFISFAALYPKKQYGLWVLAIAVPAFFHAVYNTFGWGVLGLGFSLISVVLLMTYLSSCVEMQRNLAATP